METQPSPLAIEFNFNMSSGAMVVRQTEEMSELQDEFYSVYEGMAFDIAHIQGMTNVLALAMSGKDPDLDSRKIYNFLVGMERQCDQLCNDHAILFKLFTKIGANISAS
jgi:hypothetical protein